MARSAFHRTVVEEGASGYWRRARDEEPRTKLAATADLWPPPDRCELGRGWPIEPRITFTLQDRELAISSFQPSVGRHEA